MMRPLMFGNDRVAGWAAIRDGLRACPFVTLWHGRIELNDCTVPPPRIVRLARLTFDPRSPDEDVQRASAIQAALDTTRDHNDEADAPSIRWWAAFLQIDAKKWTDAQEVIKSLLLDCTVLGIWPAYYLPEALFLASMVEFGLGNRDACNQYLVSYFDLASSVDRNHADAALLQLWARKQQLPKPSTLQCLCARQLKKDGSSRDCPELKEPYGSDTEWFVIEELPKLRTRLSAIWDEHTFASFTWLRKEVSCSLCMEEEDPHLSIADHVEESWCRINWTRPSHVDDVVHRLRESCGRTITIRHVCHEKRRNEW